MSKATDLALLINRKASLQQRFTAAYNLLLLLFNENATYIETLSQTGTNAPTSDNIIVNELDADPITWARTGTGTYEGTLTGAFEGKALKNPGGIINPDGNVLYQLSIADNDTIVLVTTDDGTKADALLSQTAIVIELVVA